MIERIGRSRRTRIAAIAIAIVLAGAAAGALATRAIAPTYAATTTVLVGSLDRASIANDFDVSTGVAGLYGNLIRSEAVLGPVIRRLGLPTDPEELRDRVHVDLDPNGIPIIAITTYADSPAEAVAIAQGITDRMTELGGPGLAQSPSASTTSAANDLEAAIRSAERRLARLERRAKTAPPKAQVRLERGIESQSTLLMTLQDDFRRSTEAPRGGANQLQILRSAEAKGGEIRPRVAIDAALGAATAVLAAAAVALAVGFRRRAPTGTAAERKTTVVRDPWALELRQATQDANAGTAASWARR
jgi:capsular polysaccharide biosynthesis protein